MAKKQIIKSIKSEEIEQYKADILRLEYVYLKTIAQWTRNARNHGLRKIIQSIRNHGFKDPMKWEPKLNNGAGGIAEGNGRDDALIVMFAEDKTNPPRGIIYDESADDWIIPVLFGVDAKSQLAAESYAIDHNNSALAGAFSETEMLRLWKPEIANVIKDIAESNESIATISDELAGALLKSIEKKEKSGGAIDLIDISSSGNGNNENGGDSESGENGSGEGGGGNIKLHQCPKCGHISEVEL